MAISSAGIGSGLDVAKIVEQTVAAEKVPLKKLEYKAEGIQTQISTYGEIKSLTSKLGDIVSKLTRDSAWNGVSISSSNPTLSGTMTGIAATGTATTVPASVAGSIVDTSRWITRTPLSSLPWIAAVNGYLDGYPTADCRRYEQELYNFLDAHHPDLLKDITVKKDIKGEPTEKLKKALQDFAGVFRTSQSA